MKLEDWILEKNLSVRVIRHGGAINSVTIGIPYGPWIQDLKPASSVFEDYKYSSMRDGYYWFLRKTT